MVEIGDRLILSDDKEYTIVYIFELEDKNYIYLIEENDMSNKMVCEVTDEGLNEVLDENIIEALIKSYAESVNN